MDKELTRKTVSHCAALLRGRFQDWILAGGGEFVQSQGTVTFLRYRDRFHFVTNTHVVADLVGLADGELIGTIGLPSQLPLRMPPSFSTNPAVPDFPFDLSVFEVEATTLAGSGKSFSLLDPGVVVQPGDMLCAVGFPGWRRRVLRADLVELPAAHVVAECVSASDRSIVLHSAGIPDLADEDLGGISGGPVFKILDDGTHQFAGIEYQAKVQDGEIWVYAHPLSSDLMERILKETARRGSRSTVVPA